MRKLSPKWPVRLTIVGFLPPILYVFFRIPTIFRLLNPDIDKLPIISSTELTRKVVGNIGILIIVWVVYGIACLFARTWVKCENCKFSDVIQDSKEMKCRLTGYNYPISYSCKNSKPKEVEGAKNSKTDNY